MLRTMLGNFHGSEAKWNVQFGSKWWFNDNRYGMEGQMKTLANLGCFGNFIGMLTDSRSFVSCTRQEYFRRIICNLVWKCVEENEYPNDIDALFEIVEGVSYKNAKYYFKF